MVEEEKRLQISENGPSKPEIQGGLHAHKALAELQGKADFRNVWSIRPRQMMPIL